MTGARRERIRRNAIECLVGILAVWHVGIAALYVVGRAVSAVPFTDRHVETLLTSPLLPVIHALTAFAIVVGALCPSLRTEAAGCSLGACVVYAVSVTLAAQSRTPPGSLAGALAAWLFAALTVIVLASWEGDGTERE